MNSNKRKLNSNCPICSEQKPAAEMIAGQTLRPSLIPFINKSCPEWSPDQKICLDCLNIARSNFVADSLQKERGEITGAEAEVIESIRNQELLSVTNFNSLKETTLGDRVSDRIAAIGGSWNFIITFIVILVVWIIINSIGIMSQAFDPYPYILLNLVLSCIAALQAPIIMMSQNRQEIKDRERAEADYKTNLKAELEIRHLNLKLDQLVTHQWHQLLEIQQIQLDIMKDLKR
jgi:uncharacterized membrane protein